MHHSPPFCVNVWVRVVLPSLLGENFLLMPSCCTHTVGLVVWGERSFSLSLSLSLSLFPLSPLSSLLLMHDWRLLALNLILASLEEEIAITTRRLCIKCVLHLLRACKRGKNLVCFGPLGPGPAPGPPQPAWTKQARNIIKVRTNLL